MLHPLQQLVRSIRRRAGGLRIAYAASVVLALVVGAAFVLGLVDYAVHIHDQGVRIILSAAFLGVLGWAVYRYLWPAVARRMSDVEVAQRIEQRFPELQDRLSSAIAFLQQREDDATAGSPELRRAVVAETMSAIERLPIAAVVDRRPAARAALAAGIACAVAFLLCLLDLPSAALAARRLAMPWRHDPWPRVHNLAFDKLPAVLTMGDHLEARVVDRNGRLPDEVRIYYWFEGEDERAVPPREMRRQGEAMVHRLERVVRTLRLRAVGGDDRAMPWTVVEVVEPPRVASLQVELAPPGYTGWPREETTGSIRALEGTRVQVAGESTRPLASAALKIEGDADRPSVAARLSDDGRRFTAPADGEWLLAKSGSYLLELVDREGRRGSGQARYEMIVVPDRPPAVSLERPGPNSYVTAVAIVPVRVVAKDDLAIRLIELRYSRSDESEKEDAAIVLFAGPERVEPAAKGGLAASATGGDSRVADHSWDLANVAGLKPGTVLSLYAAASDYKPQEDKSTARRLLIISPDELEDRIAERQAHILGQLAEVLRLARESRGRTSALEVQLNEVGSLGPEDVKQLQSAELGQRDVRRQLVGENEGIAAQVAALVDDLQANRLDRPEVLRRMESLLQAVRSLGSEHLPVIERELVSALKAAQSAARAAEAASGPPAAKAPSPEIAEPLAGAGRRQDAVIAALEALVGELSQWDSYGRFAREINQLRRDQQDLRDRTGQMRLKTLTRDVAQLSPQDKADLLKLAQRQLELARQFDKIQDRMSAMGRELAEGDPLAAATLADALEVARRRAISGQMQQSGRSLEGNQVGQAAGLQDDVVESLEEVLDVLANRRESELNRLVKKLREAAADLAAFRLRQKELIKKTEQAAAETDEARRARELERLAKENQQLRDEAAAMARRLERLQAQRAAASTGRAAQRLDRAAQAGNDGQAGDALDQERQAERELEQAGQELAQALKKAEEDLAREQLARLEQTLKGFIRHQESVLDETRRLDGLRVAQQGQFTRAQIASVLEASRQQRHLVAEAGEFAEKIAQAQVFQLGLAGAVRDMTRAALGLEAHETGMPTQQAEETALARLNLLVDALKPDEPKNSQEPPPGGDAGGAGGGGGGDGIAGMAEIKLLKLMQEAINARTVDLEARRLKNGKLTPAEEDERVQLALDQGQLAELILEMFKPPANPEDDPDKLPDVRKPPLPDNPEPEKALP